MATGAAVQVQSSGDPQSNQQNRFGVSNSLSAPSYSPSSSSGQNGAVLSQRNGYEPSSQFGPGRMPPSNGPIYPSYYMPQSPPMYHPSAYGGYGGNYGYPANSISGYQPSYYNPSAYYAQQQPIYGAHSAGMNTYGNNMPPSSYQSQQQSQQYPAHFPSLGGMFRSGPGMKSEEQKKATQ